MAVFERGSVSDWGKLYTALTKASGDQEKVKSDVFDAIQMVQGGDLGEDVARLFEQWL